MKEDSSWFICTKTFVCKRCGKSNSITLPLKASNPPNYEMIKMALKDRSFNCDDQSCREPSIVVTADEFEIVPATESEAAAFESNSGAQKS